MGALERVLSQRRKSRIFASAILNFHSTPPCKNLMAVLASTNSSFLYGVRNKYFYQHAKARIGSVRSRKLWPKNAYADTLSTD